MNYYLVKRCACMIIDFKSDYNQLHLQQLPKLYTDCKAHAVIRPAVHFIQIQEVNVAPVKISHYRILAMLMKTEDGV